MVPRSQVAECQRTAETLRAENARYKDQLLAAQAQNRDYAERAEDDYRRIAAQEDTIAQLKESNLGYRQDRDKLEAAFRQLKTSLGDPGMSTADAQPWPRQGTRSASAANNKAPAPRRSDGSSLNGDARIR
jgi:multidrug resistance efflux pump